MSNDSSKFRKAVATYCELNGNTHGGSRRQLDTLKISQEQIAKELGISERELQRLLQIENELIPELKQTLDKGFISKTAA